MTETRKLRVFLCHASQDKPIVRELYQRLLAEGWIDPWLDEEKLLPGQKWDMEIDKAVEEADAIIVCISSTSVNKDGYVQKELRKILDVADYKPESKIYILPIRIDNCYIPRSLKNIQYIDYFPEENKSIAYSRIQRSLEKLKKELENQFLDTRIKQDQRFEDNILRKFKAHNVLNLPVDVHETTRSKREVYTLGGVCYVPIPSGRFIMGALEADTQRIEEIPYSFYISRYLVTRGQFSSFIAETKYETIAEKKGGWVTGRKNFDVRLNWRHPRNSIFTKSDDFELHPVVQISWIDAIEYCKWLTKKVKGMLPHGWAITLPSEKEWEKSARGDTGRIWPWGNRFKANYCNTYEQKIRTITTVGQFSPKGDSLYGASDMVGNVWEWTRDETDFQDRPGGYISKNPIPEKRVLRGGSFYYTSLNSNAIHKLIFGIDHRMDDFGFRLALVPSIHYLEDATSEDELAVKKTVPPPVLPKVESSFRPAPRPAPRPVGIASPQKTESENQQ